MRQKSRLATVTIICFLGISCFFYFIGCSPSAKLDNLNIILISIDTLRADHLGCYGYDKPTSPNLDKLAEESLLFETSVSPSSITLPSHASMLTSLYPFSCGFKSNDVKLSMAPEITTLAEILQNNGYKTAAFTGGASVSRIYGFDRGFDNWSEGELLAGHIDQVKEWISKNCAQKTFLFFHFFDVHSPYVFRKNYSYMYQNLDYVQDLLQNTDDFMKSSRISASLDLSKFSEEEKYMLIVNNRLLNLPIPFVQNMSTPEKLSELRSWTQFQNYQTQLQVLIDSYDAGIRYSDDNLGEFFAFLKELGIWDDTLLIVTSDHGEEFMEHNRIGHGNGLFDTLVRVPLIIKMPAALKIEPQKITELTGVIDIMPTILDVTNHTLEEQMQGKSIMPLAYGQQWDRGSIFASLPNTSMIRTDNSKYIVRKKKNSGAYEKTFYYDLTTDRLEQNNLMIKGKVDVGDLNTTLYKHDESCIELYNARYSQNRDNIEYLLRDKKHVERLKALGYLK